MFKKSIRGMNQSIFATPVAVMKYEEQVITFEMIGEDIGYNPFERPFEYAKFKETEFTI